MTPPDDDAAGWLGRVVWAIGCRPRLWGVAIEQALRLAGRGWWHRPPLWPAADPGWLAFRMETIYGRRSARPGPDDMVEYLDWCRGMAKVFR